MLSKKTAVKCSDNQIDKVLLDDYNSTVLFNTTRESQLQVVRENFNMYYTDHVSFNDTTIAILESNLRGNQMRITWHNNELKREYICPFESSGRIYMNRTNTFHIAVPRLYHLLRSSVEMFDTERATIVSSINGINYSLSERLLYDTTLVSLTNMNSIRFFDMRTSSDMTIIGPHDNPTYVGGLCFASCKLITVNHNYHTGFCLSTVQEGTISKQRFNISLPLNSPWSFSPHDRTVACDSKLTRTTLFDCRRNQITAEINHEMKICNYMVPIFHTIPVHVFGQPSILLSSIDGLSLVR